MKTVYLVRHAQAVSKNKGLPDFERSLTPRGIKEARRIARHLARAGRAVDLMVSSPANRAIETAHLFAEALRYPVQKIRLEDGVYDGAEAGVLLVLLHGLGDSCQSAMVFGHDPLLSEFARLLAPAYTHLMPKGAVLGIEFECESWPQLAEGAGRVSYLDYPWNKGERARLEKDACGDLAQRVAEAVEDAVLGLDLATDGAIDKAARAAGRDVATRIFKGTRKQELVQRFVVRRLADPSHAAPESDRADKTDPVE